MITGIHHIGIAVKDLNETINFFEKVLNLKTARKVETERIKAAFISVGEGEIELIQPKNPDLPISRFIAERGEGLQHIAFKVRRIEKTFEMMKRKGVKLIDDKPRKGIHGVNKAFLSPKSTNGIMIELCEE